MGPKALFGHLGPSGSILVPEVLKEKLPGAFWIPAVAVLVLGSGFLGIWVEQVGCLKWTCQEVGQMRPHARIDLEKQPSREAVQEVAEQIWYPERPTGSM